MYDEKNLFYGVDEYSFRLTDAHVTLAEVLKEGGYQTAAFIDMDV